MEYSIIIIFLIMMLILISIIYEINTKKIKKIKEFADKSKELDDIVNKYPSNLEICKYFLRKLHNENVNIEENNNYKNCLYIAISNKIIIANIQKSFTRIQTIAHECLHSIQDRKKLLFNYIYSNIYLVYFILISVLAIFKVLQFKTVFLVIFIIMGYIYYFIRSFLENDAMIKAKYLSKEYMKEVEISDEKEIRKIVNKYDELNNIGIPLVNFNLMLGTIIKTIILLIIFLIR